MDVVSTTANSAEVSVILRRQVPIRFEETARSWFGGLPQMPRGVRWPRALATGSALNFIAQVCCADLPEQLWAGRGPREGWLLLFVDKELEASSGPKDGFVQVLHIDELGPERRPPRKKGSDDGPVVIRRWPLDVVVQEVPARPPLPPEEKPWEWGWTPLPIKGEELYGASVDSEPLACWRIPEVRPQTWRDARQMIDNAFHDLARPGETLVEKRRAELDEIRANILRQGRDAAMSDSEWDELKAKLTSGVTKFWYKWRYQRAIEERSLETMLDAYVRSAAAQATIPPTILAELEPKLRNIGETPHRMGGPRDALQGYAEPDDGDLLFQIASDDAMGWMWADLGALFVFINPADLTVRRFARITAYLLGG
ncbi:DUF1963 domain-containing protein [Rhodoblastus acidophilus]|uniref:DUF1963 domain-containing protein n=1 Tax=Rhodoblastus acidophilus TaxID=1074 RepID=A0A6N8DH22_RHOAC|nr:DUF1963 domain-containing protein [Rhodoblastus acidophilus]MCW2272709.1 hypothetical protein [Rhodoblastus acidophilus]MTV29620.1 DUF1963 domain-containing protein [Rhodoblastus acidophilus]